MTNRKAHRENVTRFSAGSIVKVYARATSSTSHVHGTCHVQAVVKIATGLEVHIFRIPARVDTFFRRATLRIHETRIKLACLWWEYHSKGNLIENKIEVTSIYDGPPLTRMVYAYDDAGNMISEENCLSEGSEAETRTVYTYDEKGYVLHFEKELLASESAKPFITSYTYDENGNLMLREYDAGSDGVIEQRDIYEYSCSN